MKKIYRLLILLVGIALTSCQLSDMHNLMEENPAPEGYVNISFGTQILGQPKVMTKVVDPDGEDINTMTLFCFDSYGLFISTVAATLTPDSGTPSLSGSFKATIPNHTSIIHFVANQNMAGFSAQQGMSESDVLSVLEGSSGMMIYWGRYEKSDVGSDVAEELKGQTINLVRNHAKVTVANQSTNGYLVVTGFVVVNSNAFGTVAPYHPEKGFYWSNNYEDMDFVTMPANTAKLSDINDVRVQESQYIFESENSSDDPLSVIIAGYLPDDANQTIRYYRVVLVDDNVEQVLVVRNFEYILNIVGTLSYGQSTYEAALSAPATNNVWLSIADNINEVRSDSYILAVDETDVVIRAEGETFANPVYEVFYTFTDIDGNPVTAAQAPQVTWLDGNNVANYNFTNSYDTSSGRGTIYLSLNNMGSMDMRSGTLLVKSGPLQRKINVVTIKAQDFTPAWITTQVYGLQTGEHITLVFNIPDNTPEAVFPMEVLISTNILDVRSSSGMDLPIRYANATEYYGSTDPAINPWGYKYVMIVNEPGKHRVYFHNILEQGDDVSSYISLESMFFNTLTREFTFTDQNQALTVENLHEYTNHPQGVADDVIYYMLVPQKKGAQVVFDSHFVNLNYTSADPSNYYLYPNTTDEIMVYSRYLDHSHESHIGQFTFRGAFNTEQGGRILGFTPLAGVGGEPGVTYHLETNTAKSAEIIRLATNADGKPSILDENVTYTGDTYRSFIFELANYRPFHFAAKINGQGEYAVGNTEETVSNISFTYQPGQAVDIEIDVTSFQGSDNACVDPFGREFEIYIDAPMLEIDAARLAACNLTADKLKADPTTPGRFIYTVASTRDAERAFGMGNALITDASGASQSGERKKLPFKTNSIVSAGEIVLSSDTDEVVFYSKVFEVSNSSISGTIKYNDGTLKDVPAQSFVPFELVSDNTRIGAVTLTSNGNYELRLRSEYEFDWETDRVQFEVAIGDKTYYAEFDSIKDLFANPNVTMTARS